MKKKHFIYLTTNLINGMQYIGQHYGYEDDSYLGSGVEFTKAVDKYGKQNFHRVILCFCESQKEADAKEIEIIAQYNAVKDQKFYNLATGGRTMDFDLLNRKKEEWQKTHPQEHQAQVDKWRQSGTEANSQPVLCITTGETFPSLCAAARHYNVAQSNITRQLKGRGKSAGKHPVTGEKLVWQLIEEEDE